MVPDPDRRGITFKRFIGRLRNLGYTVDWRVLNASAYGAPTHRRRLFIVARCDGKPIEWPAPTHGDPKKVAIHKLAPWRTAAECIDWSLPCPSIFDRKKPLVQATLRRIAYGIKRYVLDNPSPFIVDMQRNNRAKGIDEPLGTLTTQGNRFNLITPYMVRCNHGGNHFRGQRVDQPMCTVTASRDAHAMVTPHLLRAEQHHEPDLAREQLPLFRDIYSATEESQHLAQVASFLYRYYGASIGQSVDEPAPTASAVGHTSLVSAYLVKHFGGVIGTSIENPLPTTTARGTQTQIVTANLVHLNHGAKQWSGVDEPMHTIVGSGNHAALVYSFLPDYLGSVVRVISDEGPLAGLITIRIRGILYIITDIGMRMFTPRELALCQGFPPDYVLTGSKTNQVQKIGNSVSPYAAAAVVAANYSPTVFAQAHAA